MFTKLRIWWGKRAFGTEVLLTLNNILHDIFECEDSPKDKESLKKLKELPGIRILRSKGPEAVQEFRKEMVANVLKIVESDNPIRAMREALIENVQISAWNTLLFTKELYNRRQVIYDLLNKDIGLNIEEKCFSDDISGQMYVLTEAESAVLRLLQHSYFERVSKDDWWERYVKVYTDFVEMLYQMLLDKEDGKDYGVAAICLKTMKEQIAAFEKRLLSEV